MVTYAVTDAGIEPVLQAASSLTAVSLALPPGVYTTLRTYGGHKTLCLEEHLSRLETSSALLGHPLSLDRARLRQALRAGLAGAGYAESRVRITAVFPGVDRPAGVYLSLEPLAPPDSRLYERGVRVACIPLARELPRAKSTAFIAISADWYARKPPDVYEYVMVGPEGTLLEGLTSNFFGVRAGALYTAEEGVLAGVTRAVVLEVAACRRLPVQRTPIHRDALATLDEAFITSSSRDVLPVVDVDGTPIGGGRPGPVTQALLAGYREKVAEEVEAV